jgi:preprotein translocase subunit Sss1
MLLGLATSSVCCETGFSKLNLVKTYLRNRLNVVNLDALLMIMCNGPNIRVQETSDEIQELCAAAYERWLRMCKRNPNRCIFGPRPRNKAKTAMQPTYDEPDDLFDPPEKVGDGSADVTETLAADDVAEDTDEAEPGEEAGALNKLMRLAAVGPFKLAQSKRRVWEVAPKPTDAEFAAGLHVPEFKAGRDWRVAQRFEDKWHEGVLNPMRYGTLRVWWSLHYEVPAIPRKLRPGPGERRRGRGARVKRRRRRGSPAPYLGKIAGAIVHFSTSCTARPPKRIAARAASH